jgi:hypothetical protein
MLKNSKFFEQIFLSVILYIRLILIKIYNKINAQK